MKKILEQLSSGRFFQGFETSRAFLSAKQVGKKSTGSVEILQKIVYMRIDHPTQNDPESPLGGTDTVKQNSSTQVACVCLSLGHLAAKL